MTAPSSPSAAETEAFEKRVLTRVSRRSIPLLMIAYIIAFVDRSNVSMASTTTAVKDLGLTIEQFSFGIGIFFYGYLLLEVPSNYLMERVGARRWLARIMLTCALVSGSMVLVTGKGSFYLVRFLLGAVEAGLFPGVMLYLTYWFPRRYRARYAAMFAMAIPLASAIGTPISGLILSNLEGAWGYKGWQWLFVLEAIPGAIVGVLLLLLLNDRPEDARWLAPNERDWLVGTMARERENQDQRGHGRGFLKSLKLLLDPRVLLLSLIFFLTAIPSYVLSLWLPQILKSFGFDFAAIGYLSAIPFVCGCLAMPWWARRSDRSRERNWHTAVGAFVAAAGMIVCFWIHSPAWIIVALSVSAVGTFGLKGPFLSRVSESFSKETAAVGIAICVSIGNLSGSAAPWLAGVVVGRKIGTNAHSLFVFGLCSLVGGLLILLRPPGKIESAQLPVFLKRILRLFHLCPQEKIESVVADDPQGSPHV